MKIFFRRIVITACVCSITFAGMAQQLAWPATTAETKPWTRWWWQGSAVNKAEISRLLKMYHQVGLGGVEITPIYGVKGEESLFINFLSDKWVDMLQHTLKEATANNMQVDMATGTGWPFGGPWIHYEHASKQVVSKSWTLQQGATIPDKIQMMQEPFIRDASNKTQAIADVKDPVESNNNLQALAIDQIKFSKSLPLISLMAYPIGQKPVDITRFVQPDGKLNWKSPTDSCAVYALFLGWHGKMVERAAPGGEGYAIDHFSKAASEAYFKKFDQAFAGKNISALRSFFNDSYEVDDARGQSNWTPQLLDEFNKRRGYRLEHFLPALFGKDDAALNARVLFDYRETIAELILENFTKPWAAWAKKNQALVRNQSHGSPGNTMDLYAAVDIPETEGTELLRFKFATSTAHVAGKKLASAEAATWLDDHFISTLGNVKQAIDKYFIGGVNHIVYHGTNYSPENAPWPGWLFYAAVHFHPNNPFWQQFPALNKYVERSQSFLQAGTIDNDVLVYYPFADAQMEHGRDLLKHYDAMRPEFNNTRFAEISEWMLEKGYGFDFISDKQLNGVQLNGGKLLTGGASYKTILLPGNKYIPAATLQQLLILVSKGATLLVYKSLPSDVPGLANYGGSMQLLKLLLGELNFVQGNNVQIATLGKGKVVLSEDESTLLQASGVARESLTDKGMQYIRRNYQGGHVYFIANPAKNAVDGWIELTVKESNAAMYQPMTGVKGIAKTKRNADGTLSVWMQLAPGASIILHTATKSFTGNQFASYETSGQALNITGNWKVSFKSGGAVLPAAKLISNLESWTNWGEAYQYFSGTASYEIEFDKPAIPANAWKLDLGKVGESADIFLNDKKVGTVLGPDYSIVLTANQLMAKNKLRIEVSNSMANRIIQLEKQGVQWKRFYNTNFPAKLAENRGADGLFTPIKWSPKPSGLLDKVTLTALTTL